ncbi:MAG: polysaccharide biosynthesis protein [Bacteroidota bacterium]|nr:polysaccharide biosynthesis protein [Bacteroidota bacterium]
MPNIFYSLIRSDNKRSFELKKNVVLGFGIKGISIILGIIFVRIVIDYVDASRYGIWLTISSLVSWFGFFDIGLTQGLRNKLAEAISRENETDAVKYVSTSYAILVLIFSTVWILFLVANNFLNWARILNVPESMHREVTTVAVIVFTYFCFQFIFNTITTIIISNQQPAKASLLDVLGQMLSLTFVVVLTKTTQGSLINLAWALCASPLLILILANLFFFKREYRKYRPRFSMIDFSYKKELLTLGLKFFVIQIAGIIQYQTANIIIAQNYTLPDVTAYNIVYKYFGALNMVLSIFLLPFWTASTDAYVRNDIRWVRNAMRKYTKLVWLLACVGFLMLFFSEQVYRFWLGEGKVHIGLTLSLYGFLFFLFSMFGAPYISFLNGISALKIQFIACLISPVLYLALMSLFIHRFHMGPWAIFLALIIVNFNAIILAPLQYYLIIIKGKKGIWIQ